MGERKINSFRIFKSCVTIPSKKMLYEKFLNASTGADRSATTWDFHPYMFCLTRPLIRAARLELTRARIAPCRGASAASQNTRGVTDGQRSGPSR